MTVRNSTEQQMISIARGLLAKGVSYFAISKQLGVHYLWVRRRLDPAYSEIERRRRRHRQLGTVRAAHKYGAGLPITDARLRELRSNNPPDTRDFTSLLLGDPLPWRSALAQRGGAA